MSSYTPGMSSSTTSTAALMSSLPNYPKFPNVIRDYTSSIFQSEAARADGTLSHDVSSVLNGHCFYHRHMLCDQFDFPIIDQLLLELEKHEEEQETKQQSQQSKPTPSPENSSSTDLKDDDDAEDGGYNGIIHWNNHFKYEDPSFSPTFHLLTQILGEYFDLNVLATRLNIYTPSDWKTFHHDSHKFSRGQKEDFTVGLSLGATRSLAFLHPPTGSTFEFPQSNGDVFAFDSVVNGVFMHGVPRLHHSIAAKSGKTASSEIDHAGPRLSIICWGKRRTLNERNCGKEYAELIQKQAGEEAEEQTRWNVENDKDEQIFQANNKKYAYYEPPVKTDPKNAKNATTSQQQLPLTATKDKLANPPPPSPGIPLSKVVVMMKQWQDGQRQIQQNTSANKGHIQRVFAVASKVQPLLTYWIEFYNHYIIGNDVCSNKNFTMKDIQSKFNFASILSILKLESAAREQNQQQEQTANTVVHMRSSNINSNNELLPNSNSYLPKKKLKEQVMFGPKGLMIRVGATNKRFELLPPKEQLQHGKQHSKQSPAQDSSNQTQSITTTTSTTAEPTHQHPSTTTPQPEAKNQPKPKDKKSKKKNPDDFF